jgi:hypothetical protein
MCLTFDVPGPDDDAKCINVFGHCTRMLYKGEPKKLLLGALGSIVQDARGWWRLVLQPLHFDPLHQSWGSTSRWDFWGGMEAKWRLGQNFCVSIEFLNTACHGALDDSMFQSCLSNKLLSHGMVW